MFRQAIAKPLAGTGNDFDIGSFEADFFAKFPQRRVLGFFMTLNAALRELPGVLTEALGP